MAETERMALKTFAGITGAALSLLGSSAWSCPVCDSERGKAVRAAVFGSDFASNLLGTILPFLLFAMIAAAIYYGPPGRTRSLKNTYKG